MSLSHRFIQEQLQSGQRLTHAEQAAVDQHLAACPECHAYAAFHQALLETLPNRNAPLHHSEREIREKIRIVNAKLEKRRWLTRIFRFSLSLAGATAALVLLLGILIYLPRTIPIRPGFTPETTRTTAGVLNPTPISTPISTLMPSAAPGLPYLSTFPLDPGTTWVYTKTGYTQADGNSQNIIHGTSTIEERVADVKTLESYTFVHIQGNKTMVSADSGWQEYGTFGLGNYEYWYVVRNNQIYLSFIQPDPTQIKFDEMRLVYQFPLQVGSEWCPGPEIKGQPIPDNPACGAKSIVTAKRPYLSRFGELKPCFEIHNTSTSGDVISQFCEGIGVVAVKYDHGGSQFGEAQELIDFINGKDGSRLVAETPVVTDVPTQATGSVQRILSPDGRTSAFAAIDAAFSGPEYADDMRWENPAITGRRIYQLDPDTGIYQRLNSEEAYQDAPRWGKDGRLYFVQSDQEQAKIMVVNPVSGPAQPLPGCQATRLTPAGYYGQVDWSFLMDACPAIHAAGVFTSTPIPVAPG